MASRARLPEFGPAEQAMAREVWQRPQFEFFSWCAAYPPVYRVDAGAEEPCVWNRDLRFRFPGRGAIPFRFGMCLDRLGGNMVAVIESAPLNLNQAA
jgi:inner membrane protein